MAITLYSALLIGLDFHLVEVEVDFRGGLPSFTIVGLGDKAVQESKERVTYAVRNSGFDFTSNKKIAANLAPANLPKSGPLYDLPLALAYLLATFQVTFNPKGKLFVGELSLGGELKGVNGVLPITDAARQKGFSEIYVPLENVDEAAYVNNIDVFGVKTLNQLVDHLQNNKKISKAVKTEYKNTQSANFVDMAQVQGQFHAKRALTISAAGGHNLLMSGSPGSGKSLLSKAYKGLLLPLSLEERLEVAKVYSISRAGFESIDPLTLERPYRAPHHTCSYAALVGGGTNPRPGEISLAHKGVLFLDELTEFSSQSLDALRQPMEDGIINISRVNGNIQLPAEFTLIAAMNPCKCGYAHDPTKECICTERDKTKYISRISGPILDRIDLFVNVIKLNSKDIIESKVQKTTKEYFDEVILAREIQAKRYSSEYHQANAKLPLKLIDKYIELDITSQKLLKDAVDTLGLSARAYYKTIKVARTIADLAGELNIKEEHVAEALSYRYLQEA